MHIFFQPHSFMFDALSVFFLAVIAAVSIPSLIFSRGYLRHEDSQARVKLSYSLVGVFIAAMCLVVTAANLFTFLVFWELMSLASYFLVVFDYKHEKSIAAGTIYLVMTHIGTAALLAAFCILYAYAGSFSFAAAKMALTIMPGQVRTLVFVLLLFGFGTKAGVVPLHIWLPYAHPQAPSHVSSIMSGAMIKVAVYGMLRFFFMVFSAHPAWWGGVVLSFAALSCLTGILYALMDHDLKKLLAYSSVENIGIILLGVGMALLFSAKGMAVPAALSMCAALYHILNHAVFKGLLFLCAGSIIKQTGLHDMEKMGGLIRGMPWTSACFLIGALGISALPPFSGFVSEWLILQSLFLGIMQSSAGIKITLFLCVAVVALSGGLAAACFVKAFGISFLALPRSYRAAEAKESDGTMRLAMGVLSFATLFLGMGAALVAPALLRVAQDVVGTGPVSVSFALISKIPLMIAAAVGAVTIVLVLWFRYVVRMKRTRYATWDCGYYALDSRNEYTATAFSKPFRLAFSFFFLPYRKSEKIRDSFYHVRQFSYETHTTPVFKRFFYDPLLRVVYSAAFAMRKLQPGSINLYIVYIFIAVIALVALAARF